MYANLLLIHKISVYAFILIYFFKIIGLLANSAAINGLFAKKPMRILEMIASTLFLVTGVWMYVENPNKTMLLNIKIIIVLLSIPVAMIGYKKGNKILALLSFLMLIAAFGLAEMNRMRPFKKEVVANAKSGMELFQASGCVNCHGAAGNEMIVGAKDLTQSKLSDEEIKSVILNGKNAMAAYKKVLSENEISQLTEYVKTLRK